MSQLYSDMISFAIKISSFISKNKKILLPFKDIYVTLKWGEKMINKDIIAKLSVITDEEKEILSGKSINKNIYMADDDTIKYEKLLKNGNLIAIRPHTRFVDFPPHTHNYVEVVYMCKGSTTHTINGETIVLNEGEILFLSTSAVQEIKRADENDIAVNFIIKPQFFDKILEMLGEEETPLKNFVIGALTHKNTLSNYLHFKVSGIIPIQNLMENLIYTLVSDKIIKRNATAITMGLLFLELINHTDKLYTDKKTDSVLLEVFRYIDENYKDGSLNELATLLHYDFYSLSKEIKNLSGKTYTELLQEKRLSQAAFLLKHTELNVSDISVAVGYENISYFHRIFSAKFGFSPHKYRSCK